MGDEKARKVEYSCARTGYPSPSGVFSLGSLLLRSFQIDYILLLEPEPLPGSPAGVISILTRFQ